MGAEHGLAFGGDVLYVAIFWLTFALWNGVELFLNWKLRAKPSDRVDQGSYRVLVLAIAVSLWLAFGFTIFAPGAAIAVLVRPLFIIGMCCAFAGMALRLYAIRTLGRSFTVEVAAHAGQEVIDSGPYRFVRHPAYSAVLLSLMGFGLALGNWAGLFAIVVIPLCAFAYRIAIEEAALLAVIGEPYAQYMRRTTRLIPGVL